MVHTNTLSLMFSSHQNSLPWDNAFYDYHELNKLLKLFIPGKMLVNWDRDVHLTSIFKRH